MHIYHPPPPPALARRDSQALQAIFDQWNARLRYLLQGAPGPVGDPYLVKGLADIIHLTAQEIKERIESRTSEGQVNLSV
jgi:hypothetical protein